MGRFQHPLTKGQRTPTADEHLFRLARGGAIVEHFVEMGSGPDGGDPEALHHPVQLVPQTLEFVLDHPDFPLDL